MSLTTTKKMPPEQAKLVASSLPSWAQAVSFLDLVFVELSKRHDWMSVVMVRHLIDTQRCESHLLRYIWVNQWPRIYSSKP